MQWVIPTILCAVTLCACSAGKTTSGAPGGGNSGAAGPGGSAGGSVAYGGGGFGGYGGAPGLGGGLTSEGGGGADDGCDDVTKGSIYVLGQDKQFARFEPGTSAFNVLGTLSCPGEDIMTTFSMAVDRQGIAWVLYQDGNLFWVDTKTLVCTPTSFQSCQNNFCTFGMGFVADEPDSPLETLYVSGVYNPSPGQGLATIDRNTLTVNPISDYDVLAGKGAELTGTGKAQLFGYFQDMPIRLAEIDKTDAHIITYSDLNEIPTGTSWAFAFWGGSFYIMSGTGIRKYDPMAQTTTLINGNVGFNIVGAGVSTCAPTEPPN